MFKCLLLSIFTYQLVYFGWAKLEQEEMKAERQGTYAAALFSHQAGFG